MTANPDLRASHIYEIPVMTGCEYCRGVSVGGKRIMAGARESPKPECVVHQNDECARVTMAN